MIDSKASFLNSDGGVSPLSSGFPLSASSLLDFVELFMAIVRGDGAFNEWDCCEKFMNFLFLERRRLSRPFRNFLKAMTTTARQSKRKLVAPTPMPILAA